MRRVIGATASCQYVDLGTEKKIMSTEEGRQAGYSLAGPAENSHSRL